MTMMLGCELNVSIDWISGPSVAVKLSVSRWMRRTCSCVAQIQNGRSTYSPTCGVTSWRKMGASDRICENRAVRKTVFPDGGIGEIEGRGHLVSLSQASGEGDVAYVPPGRDEATDDFSAIHRNAHLVYSSRKSCCSAPSPGISNHVLISSDPSSPNFHSSISLISIVPSAVFT